MKKQTLRGGARKNAGRKSIPDDQKKKQLCIFVEQNKIDTLGGEDKVKDLLYETIDNEVKSRSFFHET